MKSIMICIPNRGTITSELVQRLLTWANDSRFRTGVFIPPPLSPLDHARNYCVKQFLESDFQYILWIDDDVVPPVEVLERLVAANKDAIGAVCFVMQSENGEYFPYPVTLRLDEHSSYKVYYGKGVEEVDATGGGCLLVHRRVYSKISRPYEFVYDSSGKVVLTCDFNIWRRAKTLGYKLYIDFDIVCSHIRTVDIKGVNDLLVSLNS